MILKPFFGELRTVGRGIILHKYQIRMKSNILFNFVKGMLTIPFRIDRFPLLFPEQTRPLFVTMKTPPEHPATTPLDPLFLVNQACLIDR